MNFHKQNRIIMFISDRVKFLFFFLMLGICMIKNVMSEEYRILDIKEEVYVKNDEVRLEDLVINKEQLTKKEKSCIVTGAPEKNSRTYTLVELAYMLQKYENLLDVKLRGPNVVTIKRIFNRAYIDRAKKYIMDYLRSTPPWNNWKIDVLFSPDDEARIAKVGPFDKLKVVPYDLNRTMLGTTSFRIAFLNHDGTELTKTTINPVILKQVHVLVADRNLGRGHILKQSDVKTIPLWIGNEKTFYVTEMKECIGKELAKSVSAGDILKNSWLLNPICVRKGEIVWVQCVKGNLVVRLAVKALEDGRQGDIVRVRNESSKKVFRVELTGRKTGVYKI